MIGALTNHLWQSTLFVVAAGLVAAALRRNGAHVRHRIWLIASLKFLVPFSILMSLGGVLPSFTPAAPAIAAPTAPDLSIAVDRIAEPFTSDVFVSSAPGTLAAPATNWTAIVLVGAWACGFMVIALIRLRDWRRIRAAVRTSVPVTVVDDGPSDGRRGRLQPARGGLAEARPCDGVQIRCAPGLLEPGVVGLWRPVLLLPAGIEQHLTPPQLEAVLAHEICHIARRDNLTSAIHMVVEAVFWFHPLVWWVGARLLDERERACDEHVLRVCGAPTTYAESILNVCKVYVESPVACVSGVGGSNLRKRVAAILVNRIGLQLNVTRKVALAMAAVLAIALPLVTGMLIAPLRTLVSAAAPTSAGEPATAGRQPAAASASAQATADKMADSAAQTAASSRFDVVSIKPCDPNAPPTVTGAAPPPGMRRGGAPWQAQVSPGYAHWECVTLAQLVDQAYVDRDHPLLNTVDRPSVYLNQPKRVRSGPAWVETDKFTIEVKAPVDVTDQGVAGSPSRSLATLPPAMSEALRAVLEDRFQVKVHRATEQQDMYALAVAKGGLNKQTMVAPAPGDCLTSAEYAAAASAGTISSSNEPAICGHFFVARDGTMTYSSFTLPQLAEDLSTILEHFVLNHTGLNDKFNFVLKPDHSDNTSGDGAMLRALTTLGLKLEPTKGPAEYLVLDHAERPIPDNAAPPRAIPTTEQRAIGAGTTAQDRKFDVASVKPCAPDSPPPQGRSGGAGQGSSDYLYLSCQTLRQLVSRAYLYNQQDHLKNRVWEEKFVPGFSPFIRGGPSWADEDKFTIEAKADRAVDQYTLTGPMTRALLEDRFQLKTHRATEERSMYALTVAKSGLKIKPIAPGDCWEFDPDKPTPPHAESVGPCGYFSGNGWGTSQAHGVMLGESGRDGERFVNRLWVLLLQPVIDRTGLNGRYNFPLEFTPDENTPGVNGRCSGNPDCMARLSAMGISDARPTTFKSSDTIFKALEKLGLKLEQTKGPAEYLVIDSAERPRPNNPAFAGPSTRTPSDVAPARMSGSGR